MKRLSVLSVALCLTSIPAFAGFHYVAETSVEGDNAGSMTVEAWIDGSKAKVLFTQSNNPIMGQGTYLLTQDAGETLYLVNPEAGTYSEWDLEAMLATVGSAMQSMGGLMKMEVSDPQVEKLLEEDGGRMLGYPTTHHRYRTSYTMELKVMGMKRGNRFESEQDIWTTTALDDDGFEVWLRSAPKDTGFEAFDKLIEAEYDKLEGFPLKTVDRTTTTGAKGKNSSTSTTTTEVTLLEEQDLSHSMFELDPALEEVPMMAVPGQMPPEYESEEEEQEEDEGGMFGKFKKRIKG